MLSRIFIFVLLLTCVYTYMLKSIEDKNDINFQKLPDNFNFELNGIQSVKPNLKAIDIVLFKMILKPVFGIDFVEAIDKYNFDLESQLELFDMETLTRLNECNNPEEQVYVFDDYISPKLEKKMDIIDYIETKFNVYKHQEGAKYLYEVKIWNSQIKWLLGYIENNI